MNDDVFVITEYSLILQMQRISAVHIELDLMDTIPDVHLGDAS